MKHYFFLAIGALVGGAIVGWFGWMVIRAVHTVISDWRLGRELDELEAECAARRRERSAQRLASQPPHEGAQEVEPRQA
jgi:hypothetical protein